MHDLVMPHASPRARIQRHDRFGEQVVTLAIAAVPVVGWRGHRQEQQAARGIEAHRRPHVRVAHVGIGAVLPRLPSELAGIGHRVKAPHAPPGAHVERLYVARRIVAVAQPVTHAVAHDHEVAVHHRWRRVGVVRTVGGATQLCREVHLAVRAE